MEANDPFQINLNSFQSKEDIFDSFLANLFGKNIKIESILNSE
jgi:hypothetical protein